MNYWSLCRRSRAIPFYIYSSKFTPHLPRIYFHEQSRRLRQVNLRKLNNKTKTNKNTALCCLLCEQLFQVAVPEFCLSQLDSPCSDTLEQPAAQQHRSEKTRKNQQAAFFSVFTVVQFLQNRMHLNNKSKQVCFVLYSVFTVFALMRKSPFKG